MNKSIKTLYQTLAEQCFLLMSLFIISACSQNNRKQERAIIKRTSLVLPRVTILANLPDSSKPKVKYLEKAPKPLTILNPKLSITHSFIDTIMHTVIAPEAQGLGFFTNYSPEQGLPLSSVTKGYCDQSGNIWFGTWGRGVSRYDGKSFTNFTSTQGLGYNTVVTIAEDKSGNLWFGTPGGATKYDGKSFVNFTTAQGLTSDKVNSIKEDKAGNLWFGTVDGGISRYDGKSFVSFTTAQGLASNLVLSIIEDKAGNLWFGTGGNGVSRYDGTSFNNFTTVEGLANNTVNSITEDKAGNLWFGTEGGASRYDGKSFTNFTKAKGLVNNNVSSITEDKAGNLWFGTAGGASRYDGESFVSFTKEHGLAKNSITSITEDKSGNLWFGIMDGGVSRYDGKFIVSFTTAQGLPNNMVWIITEDKAGNLWFGTDDRGVFRYDGKSFTSFTNFHGFANKMVISITEDKAGNLWFGTSTGGVFRYDGKSLVNFTTIQGLANNAVVVNNAVNSITEDKMGNLWFGTYGGGVSRFDGKSFTNFTTAQGLADNYVHSAIMDKTGNLWFGVTGSVSRYDGKSFTNYGAAHGLSKKAIVNIMEDKAGNLWFGTAGDGVCRFDGKSFTSFTTMEGLADNTIYTAITDKQGNIVFGTNLGFTMLKGFIPASSRKEPGAEVIEPSNNLSNEALKNYTPVFEIYNQSTGYPVKDLNGSGGNGAMICDRNGIIWAGTVDKLVRFDYAAKQKNIVAPSVFIQGIKINNEDIIWHSLVSFKNDQEDSLAIINEEVTLLGNVLIDSARENMRHKFRNIKFDSITKWYPVPENLILPYNHNNVTFDFVAIEPARPYLVKYQYILEGYDNDWAPISNKTSASFGKILEGTYTFKLKAQSPDGMWSKPITYTFKVLPPWYRTWWSYTLFALAFFVALWSFIKWREIALKKEKVLLEKKVVLRTHELQDEKQKVERTLAELKATQSQLIESEKMASVSKLQEAMLNERLRISRELHDDIGSTLSGIVLYSHMAENQIHSQQAGEVKSSLNIIQQSANDMVNRLNDLVWAVNPGHSSLKTLMQKLEEYAVEMAMVKNIKVRVNAPESLAELQLPVESRHNIYLLSKEAINNAIKYSEASLLELSVHYFDHVIEFKIMDNGKGFDMTIVKKGNGLMNMCKRADEAGAILSVQSAPGEGTVISLQCSIKTL